MTSLIYHLISHFIYNLHQSKRTRPYTAQALASSQCDIVITDDKYEKHGVAIGMQNNSAFRSMFNDFTIGMIERGIVQRMTKQYLQPPNSCELEVVNTHHEPLSFKVFLPILHGFLGLITICVTILCLEIFVSNVLLNILKLYKIIH